ncbi:MAG: hypothetical protein PHC85_01375 [Candidatus Pacebacteria bacterium]|nr:hypothetical protein [Candidatus Paceibacterota bacterium]
MGRGITIIIMLLAAVGVFLSWTKPALDQIKTLKTHKAALDSALSESRETKKIRDELLDKYNSIDPKNLERLSKMVPENADSLRLMVELSNIASASGVIIEQLQTQAESKPQAASNLPGENGGESRSVLQVNMFFSASYPAAKSFFDEIQRSLRFMDITGIEFSSESGETNVHKFSMTANAYFKK